MRTEQVKLTVPMDSTASSIAEARRGTRPVLLGLFAFALLLAAALSFWIQPLVAKLLLPVLGGSPAVWNTSLVFFQATLLAGYGFAHVVSRFLPLRGQALLHLALIVRARGLRCGGRLNPWEWSGPRCGPSGEIRRIIAAALQRGQGVEILETRPPPRGLHGLRAGVDKAH